MTIYHNVQAAARSHGKQHHSTEPRSSDTGDNIFQSVDSFRIRWMICRKAIVKHLRISTSYRWMTPDTHINDKTKEIWSHPAYTAEWTKETSYLFSETATSVVLWRANMMMSQSIFAILNVKCCYRECCTVPCPSRTQQLNRGFSMTSFQLPAMYLRVWRHVSDFH